MAKRPSSTLTDPSGKKPLPEIRADYEYAKNGWQKERDEAADDMQNVIGNPWNDDDMELRAGRPTIAPDEMAQYRNQVTNGIRREPRGMKFQPRGLGASEQSAELYQDKAREIEYRSDASEHYIGAITDVVQRSYGAFRIGMRYERARDLNPEIYIEGFADPDVVLPDPDIRREHGQDMKFAFVLQQFRRADFKRKWPGAEVTNFADYMGRPKFRDWLPDGTNVQVGEYWKVTQVQKPLHAVVLVPANFDPQTMQPPKPMALFTDEIERAVETRKVKVLSDRFVRDADDPQVTMQITNGLEILEKVEWPGRYIPIVLLFGPVYYVREGGQVRRYIGSMTRTMKHPWKAFCYACCQELEVLGQVPKASAIAYEGQLGNHEDDWDEAPYVPKSVLYALGRTTWMNETDPILPLPQKSEYTQGEYLQAIEIVKEGLRRSIQAAACANFLPTNAQKLNDKSGVALDAMDQSFTDGTLHYVKTYESGIEWGGTIIEDLFDHVYDFQGEIGTMTAKGDMQARQINNPDDPQAISTRGDHLVTVQTMPVSDSEFDAVQKFIEMLVNNLEMIASISGPQAAAYVLSTSIKMRTDLGLAGEELADTLMPPQFQSKDGKPPDPRLAGAMQQVQALTKQLQQAQFQLETGALKEKIKGQINTQITQMKLAAASADKDKDRAVKLDVAALAAHIETMGMLVEELERLGGMHEAQAQRAHEAGQNQLDRVQQTVENIRQRRHEKATQVIASALAPGKLPPAGQ